MKPCVSFIDIGFHIKVFKAYVFILPSYKKQLFVNIHLWQWLKVSSRHVCNITIEKENIRPSITTDAIYNLSALCRDLEIKV